MESLRIRSYYKVIYPVGILFILLVSCVPMERINYLQTDRPVQSDGTIRYIGQPVESIIMPGDELFIRITSADDEMAGFTFQDPGGRVYDPTFQSYTVNENGTVKLPFIGRIHVAELTLEEASDKIEDELAEFLYFPSAYLRFVNTKVSVLGEVNNPGVYMFNYKNINILQAIAYANDITVFGDRRNVLVIREEGGNRTRFTLDLTSDDLLESDKYLVKSDDIIYVEPLRRKRYGMATVPYNLILSAITTSLVVITFIERYTFN